MENHNARGGPKRPAPRVSHCRLLLQRPHLRNRQELCKQDADDAAADLPHKHGNQQIGLEIDVEGQEVPQAVSAAGEPTISMTALLELLKDADPEMKAKLRLALLT